MRNKFPILLFFALFLLNIVVPASAKVYLVSVGISDYPGTQYDLKLPAKDAKAITSIYSNNTSVEYKQLLNSQATFNNILNAMTEVFSKAGANDVILFFFAGHGYPGGFCAYDKNLNYDRVQKAMASSHAAVKLVFADACFSGKITSSGKKPQGGFSSAKKANVMLFLSSRENEVSFEDPHMSNGMFTTYLLLGLSGACDKNRDRAITARELYEYVHSGVIRETNGKQHPVMYGSFYDNMNVMQW